MKYRKKPVTIAAVRWTGDNVAEVRQLAGAKFHPLCIPKGEVTAQVKDVLHDTWIGVKTGQWIIRGVQGEFYPCDDAVFQATYEPVPEEPDRVDIQVHHSSGAVADVARVTSALLRRAERQQRRA